MPFFSACWMYYQTFSFHNVSFVDFCLIVFALLSNTFLSCSVVNGKPIIWCASLPFVWLNFDVVCTFSLFLQVVSPEYCTELSIVPLVIVQFLFFIMILLYMILFLCVLLSVVSLSTSADIAFAVILFGFVWFRSVVLSSRLFVLLSYLNTLPRWSIHSPLSIALAVVKEKCFWCWSRID